MTIEEKKKRLQHLADLARAQGYVDLTREAEEALRRLDFDKVHLVVLGEFNRGKSTLVNALVGEPLLPMDIVPTTARIWAVEHGVQRSASLVMSDGTERPLAIEELGRLSAEGDLKDASLRFVRVVVPRVATGEDVIVIDTPGVNDINEQRAEVTYGFLTNADAALYVMDASSPLTKSEAQFLQGQVLASSLERIVFVLNKTDRIDEAEIPDAVASAEERLRELLQRDVVVVPFDAARVLQALAANKADAASFWGWTALRERMDRLLTDARAPAARLARAESRARSIALHLLKRLRTRQAATLMKADERERARALFEQSLGADRERLERFLDHSLVHGRDRLKAMISASMQAPADELTKALDVRLSGMKGDFKPFAERVLPYELQLLVKRWFEANRPRVEQFLVEFSAFASAEYVKHFGTTFGFRQGVEVEMVAAPSVDRVEVSDPSEYLPLALPAAGYLAAAFLATGPFAIVGLVAGSVAAKFMREQQANAVREQLQIQLPAIVEQATTPSVVALQDAADRWFDGLVESVRRRFDEDVAVRRRDFDDGQAGESDGNERRVDVEAAMSSATAILG